MSSRCDEGPSEDRTSLDCSLYAYAYHRNTITPSAGLAEGEDVTRRRVDDRFDEMRKPVRRLRLLVVVLVPIVDAFDAGDDAQSSPHSRPSSIFWGDASRKYRLSY